MITLDVEEATPDSTRTRGKPAEVVTLELVDMLVDSDDEEYLCAPCLEIIPKTQYESHQKRGDCESLGAASSRQAQKKVELQHLPSHIP